MSDDDYFVPILCFFVVFVIGMLIGYFVGGISATDEFRKEAVERGYAGWDVSSSGSTTFKWKEAKP